MRTFLRAYARIVAVSGSIMLLAMTMTDGRWVMQTPAIAVIVLVTIALRAFQIPLTKYSALNLLPMVAEAGCDPASRRAALTAGGPTRGKA